MSKSILSKASSTDELLQLINMLPGHVCWKDLEGRYVGSNQAFADSFNMDSPKELIGKSDFELNDKNLAEEVWKNDQEIMQNNIAKDFVETGINKDGERAIYFSKKCPHKDKKGNVIGLICVATDITQVASRLEGLEIEQSKKSEYIRQMKFLDSIANTIPANMYWKDAQGKYLGYNESMMGIYRTMGVDSLIGKSHDEFLEPEIYKPLNETDLRIMQSGIGESVEEEGFDKEGRPATYISNKVPLKDENGKVIGLLGVSIDITDRIRQEVSLREAKELAELANQAKSEFLMNMSHDIRTPFIGIIGFADALQQLETDKSKGEMISQTKMLSQRLLSIIDGIIDMASADSDEQDAVVKVNLNAICKSMIALMTPQAESKNLTLDYSVDNEIPVTLYGQKTAIDRIFLNLLGNAIKFTKKGKITLSCKPIKTEETNMTIRMCVEDTGLGISQERVGEIFDKFSQLASPKGRYKGSGLGLYFVKVLTERMGGKVRVESKKGKGTKFICDVPLSLKRRLTPLHAIVSSVD